MSKLRFYYFNTLKIHFTQEWTDEGLDRVELAEYDFYLSWPNASNPNLIRLLDENGKPCISN